MSDNNIFFDMVLSFEAIMNKKNIKDSWRKNKNVKTTTWYDG